MKPITPAELAIVAALIIVIIVLTYWVGMRLGKESEIEECIELDYDGPTEWFPADFKPVHVGRYRVRFPLSQVNVMADWDGEMWRDTTNGHPCYFQQVEWQGLRAKGQV